MDRNISEMVRGIVAETLYVDPEQVLPDSNLVKDLGAESIDFLDIVFRLESEFGISIPRNDLIQQVRQGLADDEFAIDNVIQAKGLESLLTRLPGVDKRFVREGMNVRDVPSLFTIATFVHIVEQQLANKSAVPEEKTLVS